MTCAEMTWFYFFKIGLSVLQISITFGHLVQKRHPFGGLAGLGTSPPNICLSSILSFPILGIAENNA